MDKAGYKKALCKDFQDMRYYMRRIRRQINNLNNTVALEHIERIAISLNRLRKTLNIPLDWDEKKEKKDPCQ